MEPIAYVSRLNEFYRSQGFPAYNWTINKGAPLTALSKPLASCRVAMLTSGGVSRKDTAPFNLQARNDLRLDVIEKETSAQFFAINNNYYSHIDADRDINCILPIERPRELQSEGVIGEVGPHHYSGFMGRIYIRSAVIMRRGQRASNDI
jgi:D-proline reductase (dithiol) PrdB